MNRNIIRAILLRINELKGNESILIDDLSKEFPTLNINELLKIISMLASHYYIKIDGKFSHECYKLEKYNKIVGLDRDGYEAIDIIQNDKIWGMVENYLKENGYDDFSIFMAVSLAKKIIEKEFDRILEG